MKKPLTQEQIESKIKSLGIKKKDFAEAMGLHPSTLDRKKNRGYDIEFRMACSWFIENVT